MTHSNRRRIPLLTLIAAAAAGTGCGAAGVAARAPARPIPAPAVVRVVAHRAAVAAPTVTTTAIDRLTRVARKRYDEEVSGRRVHSELRRLARDARLRRLLASHDIAALRAYVARTFARRWYHRHISRLRILRGPRVLAAAGVPFVVAPSALTLRAPDGRPLATLQVSIQDEIGFVRYMRRNFGVDVVVRGRGPAHVKTSLPAARGVALPRQGTTAIAGRRYAVGSFPRTALGGERVTVWVLARA